MGATRWLVGVVAAALTLNAQGLPKLTPELASQAVGQQVTVCGMVANLECWGPRQPAQIIFRTGAGVPWFDVAIARAVRDRFEAPLGDHYVGLQVCVTGTVTKASGGFRIWARSPDQLRIEGTRSVGAAATYEGVSWACDEAVRPPRIVKEVKPQYTASAMKRGVEGAVGLMAIVDTDGSVRHLEVVRSLDSDLDEEVVKGVRQWQFEPGTRDGKPVPVAVGITLTFTLRQSG